MRGRRAGWRATSGWGIRDARGFQALSAIGMIDNSTRTGVSSPSCRSCSSPRALSVAGSAAPSRCVFAGGAIGKFVCGLVAERVGIIRTVVLTETATTRRHPGRGRRPAAGGADAAAVPLGVALNGTSSVLYATVADLVTAERRSRAYGLYYTLTIGASSVGPTVYGFVGDAVGAATTLLLVSVIVLATIPLCLLLRPAVAVPAGSA